MRGIYKAFDFLGVIFPSIKRQATSWWMLHTFGYYRAGDANRERINGIDMAI